MNKLEKQISTKFYEIPNVDFIELKGVRNLRFNYRFFRNSSPTWLTLLLSLPNGLNYDDILKFVDDNEEKILKGLSIKEKSKLHKHE